MAQPLHLDFRKLSVELSPGTWTDISQYVLTDPPIHASWGFSDDNPFSSRVASTGQMTVTLDNSLGLFSPSGPSTLAGWKKGKRVLLQVSYAGVPFARFNGFIQDIPFDAARFGSKIPITIVDWLDQTSRAYADLIKTELSKTADQEIQTVLNSMAINPINQQLDVGLSVLPFPFSAATLKTRALTEIARFVNSEPGWLYLQKDQSQGEKLRFENSHSRHGHRALTKIPSETISGFLLKAGTTDKILKAGSATDRILLPSSEGASLVNIFGEGGVQTKQDSRVLNDIEVTAYPSRRDAFSSNLFVLQQPVPIGAGQTIKIRGNYTNATTGAQCGGQNMQNMVATSDYRAWTNSDGTGTEFTANVVVDELYGGGGFEHKVINNSALSGFITLFNVRGQGIYFENTMSFHITDDPSELEFGQLNGSLDMKYQLDTSWAEPIARAALETYKDGEQDVRSVSFCANLSFKSMYSFLVLDVGSLIHIQSDLANVDDWFFITKFTFDIATGDFIFVTLELSKHWSYNSPNGLSPLSVEFRTGGVTDAINFNYLPYLNVVNTPVFTWSGWVYLHTVPAAGTTYVIASQHSDTGRSLRIESADGVNFQVRFRNGLWVTTAGVWNTGNNPFSLNAWAHILVKYDVRLTTNDPVIYINDALQVLTEASTPAGAAVIDYSVPFMIGNDVNLARAFDGEIKDFRVYDTALSTANGTILYNGGTPDNTNPVADGLLFQAFAVKKSRLAEYVGLPLSTLTNTMENMFRAVGTPNGSPTGRSF